MRFNSKAEIIVSDKFADDVWPLVEELGATKIALVVDRNVADLAEVKALAEMLKAKSSVVIYPVDAVEPTTALVNQHTEALRPEKADLIIGIGGGSLLDLTKALSVMVVNDGKVEDYHGTGKPFTAGVKKILVPTTAGTGAEVTPGAVLVNTATNFKRAIGGPLVTADFAVLNPRLTLSMPHWVSAATGMDAMGHAVESYTAKCANTVTRMYSKQGFSLVYNALSRLFDAPEDLDIRRQILLGSALAGYAIYNSNTGAAHSISYALGIFKEVNHAVAIARLLPEVVKTNVEKGCTLYADLYDLIDGADTTLDVEAKAKRFAAGLADFAPLGRVEKTFSDYGIDESNVDFLAERGLDLKPALDQNPVVFDLDDSKAVMRSLI
jgi:alcohol dehydrogenase